MKTSTAEVCLKISIVVCALALAFPASAQDSQIGKEVAIPRHLQDGEEYELSIPKLIKFGEKLFTAQWTVQEGQVWIELKGRLPDETYRRFADYAGVKERQLPTWNDLQQGFTTFMAQQIKIGKLQDSTVTRYKRTVEDFNTFLSERKITLLQDVNKPLVESFKVWGSSKSKSTNTLGVVVVLPWMPRFFIAVFPLPSRTT